MRVFLSNLGCKVNQAEADQLARRFAAAGHEIASNLGDADLHVVNSCTVTHVAARDSRKVARRGTRENPRLRTILTGCYVASDPREAGRLEGVDLVVPNWEKGSMVDRVHAAFPESRPLRARAERSPAPCAWPATGNARALVKVEDGCNMRCSFCVIPAARGRQRSRPRDEIVSEVRARAREGHREVIITGVQISSYRWEEQGLAELVEALLERTPIQRLRLSSIAPWELDARLLRLVRHPRVCRHLHLSLQSGCGATLRRMRRPYTPAAFARVVESARSTVPGVAITTDVIAGFPGETESEFEESLRFIEEVDFARLHAFPFSPRPLTSAAALPGQVPHSTKRARMERLLDAGRRAEHRFRTRQLGQVCPVLWEERRNGSTWGTTDHYIRVWSAAGEAVPGRLGEARLESVGPAGVRCRPVSSAEHPFRAPAERGA